MKCFFLISIFFLIYSVNAQNKFYGKFTGYVGDITIDSNNSFIYNVQINCFMGTFITGKWKVFHDTIYLSKTLVFDTIREISENGLFKDTLVLSVNGRSETIMKENYSKYLAYSEWESGFIKNIEKVFYKKEKLYMIKPNGKLVTKKIKRNFAKHTSIGYYIYILKQRKKYASWFVKQRS